MITSHVYTTALIPTLFILLYIDLDFCLTTVLHLQSEMKYVTYWIERDRPLEIYTFQFSISCDTRYYLLGLYDFYFSLHNLQTTFHPHLSSEFLFSMGRVSHFFIKGTVTQKSYQSSKHVSQRMVTGFRSWTQLYFWNTSIGDPYHRCAPAVVALPDAHSCY
mgnify:CR=1 FL=1